MYQRKSRPSFLPRLENLESRWCPAVTSFQDGDTLTIVGSNTTADSVSLVAVGQDAYRVTSGTTTRTFIGVNEIRVSLGGGADAFYADLRQDNEVDLRVSMGEGNDVVGIGVGNVIGSDGLNVVTDLGNGADRYTFRSTAVGPDAQINLLVNGDGNNDNGSATLNGDTVTITTGNIYNDAEVNANVALGSGNDTFNATFGNIGDDANVNLDLDAGSGNDTANLAFGSFVDNSETNLNVNLGDGNDRVNWTFNGFALGDSEINLDLDGGNGFDVSRATNPGRVINNIDVNIENMESVG